MQIVHLNTLGPFRSSLRQELEKVAAYTFHSEPNLTPAQALDYLHDADIAILAPSSIKSVTASLLSLDNLLRQSDMVSNHLPLTDQTRHLIGKKQLSLMKKGSLLINTAREEIVDKTALITAIKSGHLSGYGIETNIMTPIASNDDYLKYPNILVNAHNAFNTRETQTRTDNLVVENVLNFIQNTPQNLLQP